MTNVRLRAFCVLEGVQQQFHSPASYCDSTIWNNGSVGYAGTAGAIMYVAVREQEGREPSLKVAIIDSQTAKGTQIRPMFRTVTVISTCCAVHDAYSRLSKSFF
jgi:hypothetical protein